MERLILLCQNQQGYENLCTIVTEANINGFYYQPRVDLNLLKAHSDGLICISPGVLGPIAQSLQSHFVDQARYGRAMQRCFPIAFIWGCSGQVSRAWDQLSNDIIELSASTNHPLVALNDVYFLQSSDGWMQDMLHCIQTVVKLILMIRIILLYRNII